MDMEVEANIVNLCQSQRLCVFRLIQEGGNEPFHFHLESEDGAVTASRESQLATTNCKKMCKLRFVFTLL